MRKILLVLSAIPLMFCGCTSRNNRLSADTLTIAIDPAASQTLAAGGTLALKAICRSAKSGDVDIKPSWSVESNLGTFSPSTGKTTTFTASTSVTGTGKIYASYQGVRGSVNMVVGSSSGSTSGYVLLADAGASTDLKSVSGSIMQYFDGGDGSRDASPWTIDVQSIASGCPVDSSRCAQVTYTDGVGYWGGFYLEFNSAMNMSAYSKLTFYVKLTNGTEIFTIKIKDSSNNEVGVLSTAYTSATTAWQKVEIPLSAFTGVSTSSLSIPFIIAFEHSVTAANAVIYLDYVKYE